MDKVKIGAQVFEIKRECKLKGSKGEDLSGHIKYGSSEILLDNELDAYSTRQVLWHEVLHGILTHAGISGEDEKLVDLLSYGIIQVLEDNKMLRSL